MHTTGTRTAKHYGIMGNSDADVDASEVRATNPARSGILAALVAVISPALVSAGLIGGVGYYLIHSGCLTVRTSTSASDKTVSNAALAIRELVLQPLVVNLADGNGKTYLRAAITIRVLVSPEIRQAQAKEDKSKEFSGIDGNDAAIRDTMLEVLGRQTAEGLMVAGGKEHLKAELKTAFSDRNPELKVTDVFFTEFLVQR